MKKKYLQLILLLSSSAALIACTVDNAGGAQPQGASDAQPTHHLALDVATPKLIAAATNLTCHLDLISGRPADSVSEVSHGAGAAFEGWAAIDGNNVASNGFLIFKGIQTYSTEVSVGVERNDVVDATHQPTLAKAGFSVTSDISSLPVGDYQVFFETKDGSGPKYCELKNKLAVK